MDGDGCWFGFFVRFPRRTGELEVVSQRGHEIAGGIFREEEEASLG
jgi:hypothetical protein